MVNMRNRSTLPAQVIVCLASLALGGCHRRPDLVDTLGTAIDEQDSMPWNHDTRELAPIIVLASVEGNEVIAKHVEAARYQGVYLDLHVVLCKRENSLKGGLTETELRFFYFAYGRYPDSKANPKYKRLFHAEPGSRYLFFLTRDRGVLRSIGDVGDYSILISTGTHAEAPAKDGDIGRLVSEVLLTPGKGADLELMAKKLLDYSSIADVWGSRPLTVQLLRHLFSLHGPLRSEACSVLVSRYQGQYDCLQALAEDADSSPELRKTVLAELKEQSIARQLVLEDLKDPAKLVYAHWGGDSRHRMREELQTFLFAPDVLLHERACTALKRYYPWDAQPNCSGVKVHFAQQ